MVQHWNGKNWLVIGTVIAVLVLIAGLGVVFIPGLMRPGPTPITRACPVGIGNSQHWDAIIGTSNGERHGEGVSCASLMASTTLQALVTVRPSDAEATLDVYMFNTSFSTGLPTFRGGRMLSWPKIVPIVRVMATTLIDRKIDRHATRNWLWQAYRADDAL